jgi:hypothetical protein
MNLQEVIWKICSSFFRLEINEHQCVQGFQQLNKGSLSILTELDLACGIEPELNI